MITKEQAELFKKVITEAEGGFSIIFTQPDPDALGSAFAIAYMVREITNGKSVKVFHCGGFAHPMNRAIANKFTLFDRVTSIANFTEKDNSNVILVDSSKVNDSRLGDLASTIVPIVVVDHHRSSDIEQGKAGQCVIIEEIGASCTLVVELWSLLGFSFEKVEQAIPTLLALGIYNDTESLIDTTERDRKAYITVAEHIDHDEFNKLIRHDIPNSWFCYLEKALSTRKHLGDKTVVYLGELNVSDADVLAWIAETLIRHASVSLVVVAGMLHDEKKAEKGRCNLEGKIRISARSANPSINLSQFLEDCFGGGTGAKMMPNGKGSGGGLVEVGIQPWLIDSPSLSEDARKALHQFVSIRLTQLVCRD